MTINYENIHQAIAALNQCVKENEKKNVHRYFEVYEAMKKAVPDDNNMLEVMRACEFIIADCIAQSNVGKEVEEQTYKAIADDIRKFTEAFKPIAEEAEKED